MFENNKLKEIDKYLSGLRPSKTSDPTITPYWPISTTIWYYFCGIFEAPIFVILETTYFLLTAYIYFSAKKKYTNMAANDTKSNTKNNKKLQSISIIIPCHNEAENIEMLLLYIEKHCFDKRNVEIIFIDGGSTDDWHLKLHNDRLKQLITIPIRVIHFSQHKQSGRGICQNIAANQYAKNDILFFLHADTIVCDKFDEIARRQINKDKDLVLGSFKYAIDRGKMKYPLVGLWLYELRCNLRSSWFKCAFGDQGYFLTKEMYKELGGMPNQCIMEDYHFMGNARNYSFMHNKNIFIDNEHIFYTCPRKQYKSGRIWKNTIRNQIIVFLYEHWGYTPKQIYKLYYGIDLPETS
eukprot:15086_1